MTKVVIKTSCDQNHHDHTLKITLRQHLPWSYLWPIPTKNWYVTSTYHELICGQNCHDLTCDQHLPLPLSWPTLRMTFIVTNTYCDLICSWPRFRDNPRVTKTTMIFFVAKTYHDLICDQYHNDLTCDQHLPWTFMWPVTLLVTNT